MQTTRPISEQAAADLCEQRRRIAAVLEQPQERRRLRPIDVAAMRDSLADLDAALR